MQKKDNSHQTVNDEIREISKLLTEKGPQRAYAYLQGHLNQWKTQEVKIAVTGTSGTGKSTFINVVRGVKKGHPGFALQGRGNTTQTPNAYKHPINENILFYDLPGVGTLQFRKVDYCNEMQLEQHDVFLVFLGLDIFEDDLWLAEELKNRNKPFCFVRSKIDDDINCAEIDGNDPDLMLGKIREKIKKGIQSYDSLQHCLNLFLISSYKRELGDWDDLVSYIEDNLSKDKKEALIYSLSNLTSDIIEKKYSNLKSRIKWVTAGCSAISAVPIPFIDVAINMGIVVSEIKHYIRVFGLCLDEIEKLEGLDTSQLKCKTILNPNADMAKLISIGLPKAGAAIAVMAAESIADTVIPVLGSILSAGTTSKIVYNYLNRVLTDLKEDAILVYGHATKINREKLFSL